MITLSAFADEIGPDLKLQMDACQAQGIACIDVRGIDNKNVSTLSIKEVRQYRKRMLDRGFSVPCIGSPIGKIRMDEDFGIHLELLRHCCDVAREFGTRNVRVFSFYPSKGARIEDQRPAVFDRLAAMVEAARTADVVLMHENERAIYGAKPAAVLDLFGTIRSPHFKGVFDPGNFVEEGVAPYDEAWKKGLDALTDYFHIKDKRPGDKTFVPAGQGSGQFDLIFADLKARNWSGVMTLEPHMAAAGQFAGFTGPDLFAQAAGGLKALLDRAGLAYR